MTMNQSDSEKYKKMDEIFKSRKTKESVARDEKMIENLNKASQEWLKNNTNPTKAAKS